ncbi:MAG: superoxide dismutase, partial [Chloroflexia bacterium]|nr:superoxide dismutase [Chloroflexia bacterium]
MSLETAVELTGTPAENTEGFNFNGIVTTDDGADLIAVKSNT